MNDKPDTRETPDAPLAKDETSLTSSRRILAQAVARRTNATYHEAYKMLDCFLEEIFNSLQRNGHLEIRGFGVFKVVERKGRIGRNPRQPQDTVWIPDRKNVRFILSPQLRKQLGPQDSTPIKNDE